MSATLLTILVGLGQGLLHGLGPDHCAAVATLGTMDRRRGAAIGIALRFALGHALVLGLIGGGCLLTGMMLSESFEKWAEIVGGGVLVLIAVAATFFPDVLEHGHPHLHPHDHHGHTHAHEHAHDLAHAHGHAKPTVRIDAAAGALMAVSGVRSLVVAVPPLVIGGRFSFAAWLYLPAFALGVMLSMTAVGLVVSGGLRKFDARMARRAQQAIAIASAALGIFWIVSRV